MGRESRLPSHWLNDSQDNLRPSVGSPHELHTLEARPALRKLLTRIIGIEGPIHEDLLVQRAREAWGLARAGNRIRDNVHPPLAGRLRPPGPRPVRAPRCRNGCARPPESGWEAEDLGLLNGRHCRAGRPIRWVGR